MINLIAKGICENSNRIDAIVKHINKTNVKNGLCFALVGTGLYFITMVVNKHTEEINDLKIELENIRSGDDTEAKGE